MNMSGFFSLIKIYKPFLTLKLNNLNSHPHIYIRTNTQLMQHTFNLSDSLSHLTLTYRQSVSYAIHTVKLQAKLNAT